MKTEPKIRPLERRIMQRDTGTKQERRAPQTLQLGDKVTYNNQTWTIHDFIFDSMSFVLTNNQDIIEVPATQLA